MGCLWREDRSGQSLEQQDLLVDAEPVQHQHQVLPTAGHLALHGQAEVLLHALGDAPGDRVVPGAATGKQTDATVSTAAQVSDSGAGERAASNLAKSLKKKKAPTKQPPLPVPLQKDLKPESRLPHSGKGYSKHRVFGEMLPAWLLTSAALTLCFPL